MPFFSLTSLTMCVVSKEPISDMNSNESATPDFLVAKPYCNPRHGFSDTHRVTSLNLCCFRFLLTADLGKG